MNKNKLKNVNFRIYLIYINIIYIKSYHNNE